jgi:hypothetical protein
MKPPPFDYMDPRSLDDAVGLLAEHGDEGKILAGGQSLVPLLNFRLAQPSVIVDINRVLELSYLRRSNGRLRIGAMCRQTRLEQSPVAREGGACWATRSRSSRTRRSAIAAPSAALRRMPTPPPSSRWLSAPSRRASRRARRAASACSMPTSSS